MRYFISYNKLIEDKLLSKELDVSREDLFVMKQRENGTVKFYSASNFMNESTELLKVKDFTDMLLIEVKEEDLDKVYEKDLDKYDRLEDGSYKKIYYRYETDDVTLINYNSIPSMTVYDTELGKILEVNIGENGKYFITDRIDKSRRKLQSSALGCDLYFYTENEDLLEKFKDSTTELKNLGNNSYELSKHKVAVIDSISQSRVYDFITSTYIRFRELCDNSVRVSIDRVDDGYKLSILDSISSKEKKGYIISNGNFSNMLYDPSMEDLLDYINIYELDYDNKLYKKIPLKEYFKDHKGVKSYRNKNYRRVDKRAA